MGRWNARRVPRASRKFAIARAVVLVLSAGQQARQYARDCR